MGFTKLISGKGVVDEKFVRICKGGRVFFSPVLFEKIKVKIEKGIWCYVYVDKRDKKIAFDIFKKSDDAEEGSARKISAEVHGASIVLTKLFMEEPFLVKEKMYVPYTVEKNRIVISFPEKS